MKKIFAIWWWEIGTWPYQEEANPAIDRKLLEYCWVENPKIVFIPWYEREYTSYAQNFSAFFKKNFSLEPVCLPDIYTHSTPNRYLSKAIKDTDIVYIWGGNTSKMISFFIEHWIDSLLRNAYETWVVMSWVSSGAICRFEYGISDGDSHSNLEKTFQVINWLWFLPWICCPHVESEPWRKKTLESAIQELWVVWYGVDDGQALYIDEKWNIQKIGK